MTLLATVLAAPLLLVEIAPGADAGPDAALTAYRAQVDADSPARAVGSLTSEDLTSTRLFSTLSVGDDLRAEAAETAAADATEAETAETAVQEAQVAAAPAPRAPVTTTTTTAPPPPPPAPTPAPEPPSSGPTAAQWAALRNCESNGNYSIVSRNGLYFGAYQFSQATWNSIAGQSGRPDLVGMAPNQASPADQDAMAYALYARSGPGQWPHCGRHLY